MDILAISGSIRNGSYNTALLEAVSSLSPAHINITLSESIGSIPIFNPDVAETLIADSVNVLTSKIRKADGVIISSPEYAHGLSGVLKNTLDWLVASDALVLKPVMAATVSTSSLGGVRAHSSLVQILTAMNSNVVIDASLCIPYAKIKFDDASNVIDDITLKAIEASLSALERAVIHTKPC